MCPKDSSSWELAAVLAVVTNESLDMSYTMYKLLRVSLIGMKIMAFD